MPVPKHTYIMESPGGSTPRSTPVRLTPQTTQRGQHQPRPTQSSSLLEDVLAEKKMALMRSPEVIQFLQAVQGQIQMEMNPSGSSPEPEPRVETPDCGTRPLIINEDLKEELVVPPPTHHRPERKAVLNLHSDLAREVARSSVPISLHSGLSGVSSADFVSHSKLASTQLATSNVPSGYVSRDSVRMSQAVGHMSQPGLHSGLMSRSSSHMSQAGSHMSQSNSHMSQPGLHSGLISQSGSQMSQAGSHSGLMSQAGCHGDPRKANLVTQWLNNIDVAQINTDSDNLATYSVRHGGGGM